MSRRLERWRGQVETDAPRVVVCRGGDCGSRGKHPRFDHVGQLQRIREALDGHAAVEVSRCLHACESSNVIVVLPGRRSRDAGAEPTWVGSVLDGPTTEAVVDWVTSPGALSEPPAAVAAHRFVPGAQSRNDLAARRSARGRAG